jgi:hypothetical protein
MHFRPRKLRVKRTLRRRGLIRAARRIRFYIQADIIFLFFALFKRNPPFFFEIIRFFREFLWSRRKVIPFYTKIWKNPVPFSPFR